MKTSHLLIACVLAFAPLGASQTAEPVDAAANAKIRDEGLNRSKVNEPFDMFVNQIGPRLTGSPSHKRAADWAKDTLTKWGLSNSHLESWEFGRGWELEKLTIEMVEPRYMPLLGYAEAWTPSTAGEVLLNAVSTADKTPEQVASMADQIKGSALLTSPVITAFIDKDREQPELVPGARIGAPAAPRQGGPAAPTGPNPGRGTGPAGRGTAGGGSPSPTSTAAVLIKASRGMQGTVFIQGGRETPAATQPAVILAAEHYNIIARLLAAGTPVKLRVNVKTKFYETDKNSYNVIAEIPGTDPVLKNEVVLLGGHLDSWHTATGATDNADGAAAVMEALRIIKASGLQPKRTIRVALWSGEEEGLYGSKHFVTDHLAGDAHAADREKVSVYFNIDPGTGPIYGWYCENNAAAKSIFDAWLAPFKDLNARQNILPGIGNTDHLSFKDVGIPGFTPIQDYTNYDVRLHHTNVDTAEYVKLDDLKQNAIVLASFAYQAAQRSARIPR
jgi:carboxypeptidase Q